MTKNNLTPAYEAFIHSMRFVNVRSANTITNYTHDITQFLTFLESIEIKDYNDLSYETFLTFIVDLKAQYAPNTVYRKISALRVYFQFLKEHDYIKQDLSAYIRSDRRPSSLPKALTLDEIRTLLSFERKQPKDFLDYTLILLLFRTGLRVSECTSLEFVHLYQEERLIRFIGKGNKERIVPMNIDTHEALLKYINEVRPLFLKSKSNRIFITKTGKLVTRQYIYHMLQSRSKETGLKSHVSPHILRHTMATVLLEEDVDLRVIQELLGHSDISTTQIYTKVRKNVLQNEYNKYLPGGFDFDEEKE